MFDSPKELLDKIRLGEDSLIELKEVRFAGERVSGPHRNSLADEMAALANSHGGVCVLGVEDGTREIIGIPLEKLDVVEAFVREVCTQSVEPPLAPLIQRLLLPASTGEELAVIKVEVERSLFVHKSAGGYLHRVGSAKREMSPEFLARLFQQRSQARIIRFDEQVVPRANLDDLTPTLWERFKTGRSSPSREDLLVKLGMARPDDGQLHPTVAGVLMATREPRNWMPNAFIQAVAYRGFSGVPAEPGDAYQLDAADVTGPLDQQIVDACRFVMKNMTTAATKEGVGRQDLPQFDLTAVFEAIVNAVAHRDYSIHGSKIRLRLFADRLEIYSPGAIANTMTVDSLAYRQSARNETITSLLARCPVPDNAPFKTDRVTLMDKRGEGVRIILENSTKLSGQTPEYRLLDESELMLTIFAANPADTGKP
jgi:predicted HTH transcriptional regulator